MQPPHSGTYAPTHDSCRFATAFKFMQLSHDALNGATLSSCPFMPEPKLADHETECLLLAMEP
eukprot:6719647-Lingulodinium_polyedra.AAC.1